MSVKMRIAVPFSKKLSQNNERAGFPRTDGRNTKIIADFNFEKRVCVCVCSF